MNDSVKTVKMVRDPESYPEPHEADVHPDMVADYSAAGFVPDEDDEDDEDDGGTKKKKKPKAPARS